MIATGRPPRGLVVYSGALAQVPRQGGLTWFHLQFLLGLRRLGWEVLFLDHLTTAMCVDDVGRPTTFERSLNLRYFLDVMRGFDLEERFSLVCDRGERSHRVVGLPRAAVHERVRQADLLIDVMGYLDDPELLAAFRRRVFVDIDPGFPQMWRELGLHDAFAGYDQFVSLARNIGQPDCGVPTCGLDWVTLAQPVVLEHWPARPLPTGGAFTSIGAWRGPNAPIVYGGRTYGLRAHELRRFVTLPTRCRGVRFELALDIHPGDHVDRDLLRDNGWALVAPHDVAGGPSQYREYLANSRAEFMVPKEMYVATRSGLLSDRSVYYLATGRPVLARDTAIGTLYPTGRGLLTFATLDEAVAGVEAIERDPVAHARAARELAVAHFDSDRVLQKLLDDLDATRDANTTTEAGAWHA